MSKTHNAISQHKTETGYRTQSPASATWTQTFFNGPGAYRKFCIYSTKPKALFQMGLMQEKVIHAVSSHRDGGLLRAPLLCAGVEEDIAAASLAVLVHDQPDLTGLQLGDWPAT